MKTLWIMRKAYNHMETDFQMYECDNCNKSILIPKHLIQIYDTTTAIQEYQYCPHCGAEMDTKTFAF